MLQTVASLIDNAKVVIYDRNMFMIQATGAHNYEFYTNCKALSWPTPLLVNNRLG